jgi:hypothetical protein
MATGSSALNISLPSFSEHKMTVTYFNGGVLACFTARLEAPFLWIRFMDFIIGFHFSGLRPGRVTAQPGHFYF